MLVSKENYFIIAGPCSVESEEQIVEIAKSVKKAGAQMLRGGAYKPRTSPYDFQGLHKQGLEFLRTAKKETGLPVVSEILGVKELELFDDVDVLQVGARNMQNYELLTELGHSNKPILLKRGMGNTLKELLYSAEYIMSGGNQQIILCERGIRTFNETVRNTLDLSAVPLLHQMTHLPVIVDPSHGTGLAELVPPMAKAAVACGADGIMVEVHSHPNDALSDGPQALLPEEFAQLVPSLEQIRKVLSE